MPMDFITPDWPAPKSIKAFVTTRQGGGSEAPYDSLNPAFHVNDKPEKVRQNRQLINQCIKTRLTPQWLEQVHGVDVLEITTDCPGINQEGLNQAILNDNVPCADAAVTSKVGQPCAVMTADCLPVMFCNRSGDRVGVAHAGWRGLAAGVLENTRDHFEQPCEELMVWFGPAIGPNHFEVGEEVRDVFMSFSPKVVSAFKPNLAKPGHWFADLYLLAEIRLNELGIKAIYGGNFCTFSDSTRFYSYRRDRDTGRMASIIWLE